jgi:predicted double-glycine peptidase
MSTTKAFLPLTAPATTQTTGLATAPRRAPARGLAGSTTFAQALQSATLRTAPAATQTRAVEALQYIRGFDQTSVAEYDSSAQARTWGYSTCSAASLTAILRGRGIPARIADVMAQMPGGITVQQGLVSRPSLVGAAQRFGLAASDDVTSYEALAQATAQGEPVMVDITNRRFPEGHWIVVTGVTPDGVTVADSSRHNTTFIPRAEFEASWSRRGIRVQSAAPAPMPAATPTTWGTRR